MNNFSKTNDFVVLYDGSCALCAREIDHYQQHDHYKKIDWINFQESPNYLTKYNLSWDEAMKKLHCIENDQVVHVGVDSFIHIWQRIDRYHFLAALAAFKPVYFVLSKLYNIFAEWRFKKQCNGRQCINSKDSVVT